MSNAGFYIFALVAVIIAGLLLKNLVSCLIRTVVIVVLLVALAFAYWFLVGQYDPEMTEAVDNAVEQRSYDDSSAK